MTNKKYHFNILNVFLELPLNKFNFDTRVVNHNRSSINFPFSEYDYQC